jgi:hypothetical protein
VAVLLGLVLWQAAGIAYEVAYSVSHGQSPLSGFACTFPSAHSLKPIGATSCLAASPSSGGSSTSSGVQPAGNAFGCIISPAQFASCVASIVEGLPVIQQLLQAVQSINQALAVLEVQVVTIFSSVASLWTQFESFLANLPNILDNFLGGIVSSVSNGIAATVQSIVSAFEAGVQTIINAIAAPFQYVQSFSNQVAVSAGPLAPVVVILIVAGVVLVALFLIYLFINIMWGVGKTIFNFL